MKTLTPIRQPQKCKAQRKRRKSLNQGKRCQNQVQKVSIFQLSLILILEPSSKQKSLTKSNTKNTCGKLPSIKKNFAVWNFLKMLNLICVVNILWTKIDCLFKE